MTYYIVHTTHDKKRERFAEYSKAFRVFKMFARHYRGVALWHGYSGAWCKLYATEGYPECYSRPYGRDEY